MENKQTAVDFLEESIHLHCLINDKEDVMIDYNTLDKLFMKARAMEKKQILKAFEINYDYPDGIAASERYYKRKYGSV